jgi:hypothetical protein
MNFAEVLFLVRLAAWQPFGGQAQQTLVRMIEDAGGVGHYPGGPAALASVRGINDGPISDRVLERRCRRAAARIVWVQRHNRRVV